MTFTPNHTPNTDNSTTVLLVNLGSPDDTSVPAVRRYLAEFLSDRRVIDLPRWFWLPLLHGIILRTRPKKTAAAYQSIWTENGSPLVAMTQRQTQLLNQRFTHDNITVRYAMRYGNPSMQSAIDEIINSGCQRLLVFPLYPQYSRTTVESVRDKLTAVLGQRQPHLSVDFIEHYYDEPLYINALANRIKAFQQQYETPDKLIFSYHGVPLRYIDNGDCYYEHCKATTQLAAKALNLAANEYIMTFQSRFGKEEWIKPYTDETLKTFAQNGVKIVHVLSPAFAADCLETLEELEVENRAYFETANGEDPDNTNGRIYRYVPALNDDRQHIDLLESIIRQRLNA